MKQSKNLEMALMITKFMVEKILFDYVITDIPPGTRGVFFSFQSVHLQAYYLLDVN